MASCARRTVQLEEDDLPYRKGSNATIRSEGTGTEYYTKRGILSSYDSQDTIRGSRPVSTASNSSMRVRRLSSLTDDNTRFPKLQDCAHFHYDTVDINSLKVCMCDDETEQYHHNGEQAKYYYLKIASNDKTWMVRRTLQNFRMLDQKLHRCIFDRKFSHLPDLALVEKENITDGHLCHVLADYLNRFSTLAGSMLNCGSVLNWLEIDNRGHRLLAIDDSGINTPAIAAAHAIKRYTAQAADEISLEVGDIVSVIDMPPTDDTIWWRGKRGFEVGFFPYECVELIGDKVPPAVCNSIPETPANRALLKKHGKFISFLRLFFNTRPERIQLKQSGIVKERVFGCDLGEHLLNSGHDVPLVLKSCTDVIESHGLVDGIYRLSGITSNIQRLRLAFDEDRVPDLTSEEYLQDVHSISSLLKMYFRELPNPLLTYQLYDKFASAVKDEDNKLLRIHDVVQQLPPPHYRTTEYLMRHLARVAAHGHETGMHSKNLAIVWAPNLLRSKELESGGGAAALQGVGIQAVVTEFLILYADLIFSDKMPSYSSPELKKTAKKPRPKSLAISTPTRLLTLEEARERALLGNIVKADQKYIDVGGGPQTLPAKYHTVLDLPGYKKKSSTSGVSKELAVANKGKKSPGGLKSLFTKSRTVAVRQKGRKPSLRDSLNFDMGDRKAITEEDVQHWKRRRIRSAKSAESLLSLPVTSKLGSPLSESLDPNRLMNILAGKENTSPSKYTRSMSIESPRYFSSTGDFNSMYPSYVVEDDSCREMAIDVNPKDIHLDFSGQDNSSERETSESPETVRRKQSFIRNDQKRRVICHRRVPSAPTSPRGQDSQDYAGSSVCDVDDILEYQMAVRDKSVSQPTLDSKPPRAGKNSSGVRAMDSVENERFYVHSIMPASVGENNRNSDLENGSEKRKGSKTPPKDRKKLKEGKDTSPSTERVTVTPGGNYRVRQGSEKENVCTPCDGSARDEIIAELPESPGNRRKLWSTSSTTSTSEELTVKTTSSSSTEKHTFKSPFIVKRYNDYDEIDEAKMVEKTFESQSSQSSSHTVTAERVDSESAISRESDRRYYRVESIDSVHRSESQTECDINNKTVLETDFPTSASDLAMANTSNNAFKMNRTNSEFMSEINKLEQGINSMNKIETGKKSMSKCMSIPSDIQKSLENIQSGSGSHSDIMSSVTISELSMSQENVFGAGDASGLHMERRRRSTSLDGLNDESPLSRTLKEINAQIDKAFKHERHKAQTLKEMQAAHRACQKQTSVDVDSDMASFTDELNITPTGHRSFGSMRDMEANEAAYKGAVSNSGCTKHNASQDLNKFVDRPATEIHIADSPRVIRAPLRSSQPDPVVPATEVPATTPTRPSPPASLDIVCTTASSTAQTYQTTSDSVKGKLSKSSSEADAIVSPYANVPPAKTGFRMSEEDFQRSLMCDPESLKQFEQSMMYSPVRARSKVFPDSDKSSRSSVVSPFEGVIPRNKSNRSSITSPDASPGSYRAQVHNRSFGSPETSPLASRPPRNQGVSSIDTSPQSRQKHGQLVDMSPKSRQKSKLPLPTSAEASPTTRQKLNQSYSSSEGSPQSRQKQAANQSFSSVEGSPQSGRQKLNQSYSSIEASPPTRHKQSQSFSSSDSSPQTRHQKLNQSSSSLEASPQFARNKTNQSRTSVENSPQTVRQRIGSCESSPQTSTRPLGLGFSTSSPQMDSKRYGASPRSGRKSSEGSHLDRRSFIVSLPKMEQRKGGSLVSSPLSPEHKQPRWEDLAGLNEFNSDSFNEFDMAVFNDNWKKCLAPTGDSIRLSNNGGVGSNEQLSRKNEFPEVGTGTDTVVFERPSIQRKATTQSLSDMPGQASTTKTDKVEKSKAAELETYDNVPDHEAIVLKHGASKKAERMNALGRPLFTRSHTVPESSTVPESPTSNRSGVPTGSGYLEHSSSFESSSSYHGAPLNGTERSVVKKSSTAAAPSGLTRQTSIDSYKTSVQLTSLGSSFEESDVESRVNVTTSNVNGAAAYPGSSYITLTSNERSQSEYSSAGGFTKSSSNQQSTVSVSSRQSSVLIRSESTQSADYNHPDSSNANTPTANTPIQQPCNMPVEGATAAVDTPVSAAGSTPAVASSVALPQMLEEMEVNDSCLGIASYQNMSNEMKEMMQEQMKEHAGILSPLDEVMAPFSTVTSPRSNQLAFFDANHPLAGFDMESSIEVPVDVVCLPEIHLQYLSDGPTVIATPTVLDQLNYTPSVHQPIDNTEEEFQNAINDDLERNLASLQEFLPQHASVCEPDHVKDNNQPYNTSTTTQIHHQTSTGHTPATGLEHLAVISADSYAVVDTPPPVMQDSMSSSTSSQVDLMSTSFTYPQNFDAWHYHSPMVNGLSMQGDLAPPPLEMIEICKSVLVKSKPPSGRKSQAQLKKHRWEYPKILDKDGKEIVKKKTDKSKSVSAIEHISSERGEEKLVLDNRPCLKKHGRAEVGIPVTQLTDQADSDQGDNSEDDVFVDNSDVTPETSFFAAGSKYFKRRDFLSYGHAPSSASIPVETDAHVRENRVFSFELPSSRGSTTDESGMNGQRGGENFTGDFSMDIGHESEEDIRFSKAHRSSKLLTLCEKFEAGQCQSPVTSEPPELEKKKSITPPEKNLVSSIRQMHESLEKAEGKPPKVRQTSLDEEKARLEELSVITNMSPTKDGTTFAFSGSEICQKSPGSAARDKATKELASPHGKPPKYKGKIRTPSESSLSETDTTKTAKPKTDGSPKMRYEGSPKGQRQSLVLSDEGSPKMLPHSLGSQKGQRFSTEVSPKLSRGKEGPPVLPKHSSGSPTLPKSADSSSKIPVLRQTSFSKDDLPKNDSNSNTRYGSSPKTSQRSWSTGESDVSGKSNKDSDVSDQGTKVSRIPQADTAASKTDSTTKAPSGQKLREKCDKDKSEKKRRRGSIKELTNIFEEKIENLGKSASSSSSPTQVKLRSRVRSVSPNSVVSKSPTPPLNVRHSMELPGRDPPPVAQHMDSSAAGKAGDNSAAKFGSVRMGPKPFYGAK